MSVAQRKASPRPSANNRSQVTNGKRLLAGIDGRSSRGRRLRDVMHQLTADLGGPDAVTVTQGMLIKQAAALTLVVEDMQARVVNGEAVDPTDLTRLTGSLTRVLSKLGIREKAKPKAPTLREIAAARAAASGGDAS
jgi:hypothetical protein